MDAATSHAGNRSWDVFFAGLQAGLIGVTWMLAWLGMNSMLERRSFWTPENLMASAFYGNSSMRTGFSGATVSGLALYILLYCVLGGLFAWAAGLGMPRLTQCLAAVACALVFYWLTFQMAWRSLVPLAALLHSRSGTILGHLLFGTMIARFPAYLPRSETPAPLPEVPAAIEPAGQIQESAREER